MVLNCGTGNWLEVNGRWDSPHAQVEEQTHVDPDSPLRLVRKSSKNFLVFEIRVQSYGRTGHNQERAFLLHLFLLFNNLHLQLVEVW